MRTSFAGELFFSFIPIFVFIWFFITIFGIFKYYKVRSPLFYLLLVSQVITLSIIVNYFVIPRLDLKPYIDKTSNGELKILTNNILFTTDDYSLIENTIYSTDPDVVVLIEFVLHHDLNLSPKLVEVYPYKWYETAKDNNIAYFSKYPIVNRSIVYEFESKIFSSQIQVQKDNDIFTIVAIHTSPPISNTLWEQRNIELTNSLDINKLTKEKTIIAGDLNISPYAYHYSVLESGLEPSFYNPSLYNTPTSTWTLHRYLYPISSHIDHFFVSKDLVTTDIKKIKTPYSDHEALLLTVKK